MPNQSFDFSNPRTQDEFESYLSSLSPNNAPTAPIAPPMLPPIPQRPAPMPIKPAMVPPNVDTQNLVKSVIQSRFNPQNDEPDPAEALKDAQEQVRKNKLYSGLADASSNLGYALAGVKNPNGNRFSDQSDPNAPVDNLLTQQKIASQSAELRKKKALDDPDSQQSVIARNVEKERFKLLGADPSILDGLSASQVHDLSSSFTGLENSSTKKEIANLTAEQRREAASLRKDSAEQAKGEKKEKQTAKDLTTLGDALDENKGRAGELGRQAQTVNNADRVLALAKQFPDYKFPSAQMAELAGASAALVQGGSHPAEGIVQQYIPNTKGTSAAAIQSWLTDQPVGSEAVVSFAKLMVETAEREKALAEQKVKGAKFSRVAQFGHLQGNQQFNNVLESHGVDPEEYAAYVKAGHKMAQQAPDSVEVRLPNGKTGRIPRSNLAQAVKRGAQPL